MDGTEVLTEGEQEGGHGLLGISPARHIVRRGFISLTWCILLKDLQMQGLQNNEFITTGGY